MNIYFVNKNSSIKGPLEILDAHRNRIMKVGDVCILEDNDGVSFLLIVIDTNKWSKCKHVGHASGNLGIEGNSLLFSFDGIKKRYGKLKECIKLRDLFEEEPLQSFFNNVLEILMYKCDFWDASIFRRILELNPVSTPTMINQETMTYNKTSAIFKNYLSEESQQLYTSLYSQGKPLRQIFEEIRTIYRSDFRQAIKKFLEENPNKSIYDKS